MNSEERVNRTLALITANEGIKKAVKLSIQDPKSLNQCMLKMVEELGELSTEILKSDRVIKNKGKFNPEDAVEEATDVLINAITIYTRAIQLYSEVPYDVAASIFDKKLKKWGEHVERL